MNATRLEEIKKCPEDSKISLHIGSFKNVGQI